MIIKNVPFYANPDSTHCYQASLKTILKFFIPNKDYSLEELEKLTAKKEGLWTWSTQSIINLHKMGFEIIDIEDWNIDKFVKNPKKYLIKTYGKAAADKQEKYSDLEQEKRLYKEYGRLNILQKRIPNLKDIFQLIDKGFLVGCSINHRALDNMKGYSGHFVIIFGYDGRHLYMHDPGPPARPNRKETFKQFKKAWEYPDKKARNLKGFNYHLSSNGGR